MQNEIVPGRTALFPASLDLLTNGHLDVIERILQICDNVLVVVANNAKKLNSYAFPLTIREAATREALAHLSPRVQVTSLSEGLLVDYAWERGINLIIKGVRDAKDVADEETQALVNSKIHPSVQTLLMPARSDFREISSSMVKTLYENAGPIHQFVPLSIKQRMEELISRYFIVGTTGEIHSGKTYLSKLIVAKARQQGIPAHFVELDKIGHKIHEELTDPPIYQDTRNAIRNAFQQYARPSGRHVMREDGFIDRKLLGEIVFEDVSRLWQLNSIMEEPMLYYLRKNALQGKEGLIVLEAAILAESDMSYLCNNNVILVGADEKTERERLHTNKGYSPEEIDRRMSRQFRYEEKKHALENAIARDKHGYIWTVENSQNAEPANLDQTLDDILTRLRVPRTGWNTPPIN